MLELDLRRDGLRGWEKRTLRGMEGTGLWGLMLRRLYVWSYSPSNTRNQLGANVWDIGWAISTGSKRAIKSVADLKNSKIGVSRVGSGSYVMGFVLADGQGWLSETSEPFEVVPLQTFENLRKGVNDGTADFFMWEHFTSKRYYDNGEIKRIGEIYTPWSSWKIVAATSLISGTAFDPRLDDLFEKLNRGTKYFVEHSEESVEYISTELDYSEADAREWLKTVEFSSDVKGVDLSVIQKTVEVLKKAGVIKDGGMQAEQMIGRQFGAQRPGPVS